MTQANGKVEGKTGVLFVCLGNICRSPLAEGVFLDLARNQGIADHFDVDSAGTGNWHVGEKPDGRALAVAKKHGVTLVSVARQVDPAHDFSQFDWIIPMDRDNERDLLTLGARRQRTRLLRSFDPALSAETGADLDVPDPYFGQGDGFERVFAMIERACAGALRQLSNA